MVGIVETFGVPWGDVMRMPFRTFMALNRVATARNVNSAMRKRFEKQLDG